MTGSLSRRGLLAAAVGVALAATIVPWGACRASALARVDLYDRTLGQPLPAYRHLGRQYVAGEPGHEYAIRIRNCSDRRVLAVVSVDGVNVISGETAAPGQSGYVIEPGDYVSIQGWRKDLSRTAAFYFTDPQEAYATRTGRPANLGVIGVALFREGARPGRVADAAAAGAPPAPAAAGSLDAAAAKSAERARNADAAVAQEPSLGTGHGRREESWVEEVSFERASDHPDEVIAIRYERRETLVAMGVLPTPRWPAPRRPDPFPGALSFAPDP